MTTAVKPAVQTFEFSSFECESPLAAELMRLITMRSYTSLSIFLLCHSFALKSKEEGHDDVDDWLLLDQKVIRAGWELLSKFRHLIREDWRAFVDTTTINARGENLVIPVEGVAIKQGVTYPEHMMRLLFGIENRITARDSVFSARIEDV